MNAKWFSFWFVLWLLLSIGFALMLSGCTTARRGDFEIQTIGANTKGNVTYARVDTNGAAEYFEFKGSRDEAESTHTAANAICTIVGGIVGAGTPLTPAGGAAIGLGTSEVWQTVKDYLRVKAKGIMPKKEIKE